MSDMAARTGTDVEMSVHGRMRVPIRTTSSPAWRASRSKLCTVKY